MSISMYSICMNIIIHLLYLKFTFQRNTDVLWYLFTISRKIIVLIFILKYESIVCKWLKALYNFLTQVVFFMEISKTESAEIKFLIHQNADLWNLFRAKIIFFFTYFKSLIQRKGNFIIFYQTNFYDKLFKKINKNIITMIVIRFNM